MHSALRNRYVQTTLTLLVVAVTAAGIWYAVWRSRPRNADTLYQKGAAAVAAEDFHLARKLIFQLRFIPGQEHRVDLLQGIMDLKRGLLLDAARELASAAGVPETRLEALALFGETCYHLGRHAEAQQALREVLLLEPQRTESRRWLAASYYDIGAMQLAIEELSTLSSQLPQDGRPCRLRAMIQKDFELFQEAIHDYQESLRRDPDPADREEMLLELAECQLRLHQYDGVLQTIRMMQPSSAGLALQAECQRALNQIEEAELSVAQALELNSQNSRALLLQAEFLDDAGDLQGAAKLLQQAVSADPWEHQIRFLLSGVYRRLGQISEADREAAEASRLQQLREEFSQLHEQAFVDTQDAEIRFQLGKTATELGKPELAKAWFQAALSLNPGHQKSREAMQNNPSADSNDQLKLSVD